MSEVPIGTALAYAGKVLDTVRRSAVLGMGDGRQLDFPEKLQVGMLGDPRYKVRHANHQ